MNPITFKKLTYKEAYDKIIDAYFKDEIEPYDADFCFCGTLAPNIKNQMGKKNWNNNDGEFDGSQHFYTFNEYVRMEAALLKELDALSPLSGTHGGNCLSMSLIEKNNPIFEDRLFKGMCSALEVLKSIHESKGETIDSTPSFTKRELA